MFAVKTDHQIVAFETELMRLYDRTGTVLVTATRTDGQWTVHADGIDDYTTTDRGEAVTAMQNHALTLLRGPDWDGPGYSTFVPRGLRDMP